MNAVANSISPVAVAYDLASNTGTAVFWCGADKQPWTKHGFKDATTDLDVVEATYRSGALLAVPTGAVSRIFVVDVDPDGADWYREKAGFLACGRIHRTRRGWHLLYRMPPGVEIRNSASKIAPGIDVRGDGGYIIWWPAHGHEVTGDIDDITEAPTWLLELVTKSPEPERRDDVEPASGTRIVDGRRNSALTSLAGKMRHAGASLAEIEIALPILNGRCLPPLPEQEVQRIAQSVGRYAAGDENQQAEAPQRAPLDWNALADLPIPQRDWIIDHWIPRNEVTLLAGPGGIGKTGVAQALGSCVALQREYLDWVSVPRKVLMWAGEDDPDELHRRQVAIAAGLGVTLQDFAGKLFVESYHRTQIDLAARVKDRLVPTPMLTELREQIGDYGVQLVILDNIARLFAGNENDRHEVSSFITMLNSAAAVTKAGVILLGHPAKAAGSEFSGSTAWEGAVRTRLYLGAKLPDQHDDDEVADDSIRYLCRRKANYSTKDWRRIKYVDGVMVPEASDSKPVAAIGGDYAKDTVLAAVRKLATMNEYGNASTASPGYLPKMAKTYGLLDRLNPKQFTAAMVDLRKAGRLSLAKVGQYSNRSPRMGLVEAMS